MNCYFDTSAFIKLYHDENGTDALQLGTALVSNKIYPVDLFISSDKRLYEVASNYLDCWDPCDQPVPRF